MGKKIKTDKMTKKEKKSGKVLCNIYKKGEGWSVAWNNILGWNPEKSFLKEIFGWWNFLSILKDKSAIKTCLIFIKVWK